MGNVVKKVETRLKQRQDQFDSMKDTSAFTRPGSRNIKKNARGQGRSMKRR